MSYFRAIDPYPLESAEHNKLHEFYEYLSVDRLVTTMCKGCHRIDWPPRGFCPDCTSDQYDWVDLPHEGTIHAFTVQEAGIPAGFSKPLIFAVVKVGGLRIFAPIVESDPAAMAVGKQVRFQSIRVADDPQGAHRYLPAFAVIAE